MMESNPFQAPDAGRAAPRAAATTGYFEDEERKTVGSAGAWLAAAGGLQVLLVLLGLVQVARGSGLGALFQDSVALIGLVTEVGLPALLATLTLLTGLQFYKLREPGQDQQSFDAGVRTLTPVYQIKGILIVLAIVLFFAIFLGFSYLLPLAEGLPGFGGGGGGPSGPPPGF